MRVKFNIQKTEIMATGPITLWRIEGEKVEAVTEFFPWAPESLGMVIAAMKFKDTWSWKESYDNPRQCI